MKMALKSITKISSVVFAVGFLSACGSSETSDSGASTSDTSSGAVSTSADTNNVSSESMQQDVAAPLKTVFYFDFDQSALTQEARVALDAQAAYLLKTDGTIRLEAHADDRGTREYNLALGERRGKAVENYLAIQGVSRTRIETISYGEEKPVAFGSNEKSWALNRRVEIR